MVEKYIAQVPIDVENHVGQGPDNAVEQVSECQVKEQAGDAPIVVESKSFFFRDQVLE